MSVSLHPPAYSPLLPSSGSPATWVFKPVHDLDRSYLTRPLRQRTMRHGGGHDDNDNDDDDHRNHVSNTSHTGGPKRGSHLTGVVDPIIKRTASPSPPRRLSQDSFGRGSKSPLTPEVNSSYRPSRKRTAGQVDQADRRLGNTDRTFSEPRRDSEDSVLHVCICQPDPKIPRPRNAFILYRQHHQAGVVAQHPGLANPEISKIIGEQWQNQSVEVKNKWKALAEEEKIRHQQQHPTYRYQPKRGGRRNSLTSEGSSSSGGRSICPKCGGQTTLAPVQPSPEKITSAPGSATGPTTPASVATPVTRTLPTLRELSLQSPSARPPNRISHDAMAGVHMSAEERDAVGSLSPGSKRRRLHDAPVLERVMPSRYANTHAPLGTPIGPGTPYPFVQPPQHTYPVVVPHDRRDNMPGMRGMMPPPPPSTMAPPPRPVIGYQQHRVSQGHAAHDRSLTLPPLQTGNIEATAGAKQSDKSVREQIMSMDFRYKIKILNQVAPPTPLTERILRGPLIAIEGDNEDCVNQVAAWLHEELGKGNDRRVNLLNSPMVSAHGSKEMIMAAYHRLIADWLEKSSEIHDALIMHAPASSSSSRNDSIMHDAGTTPTSRTGSLTEPPSSSHDDPHDRDNPSFDPSTDNNPHKDHPSSHPKPTDPHQSSIQPTPSASPGPRLPISATTFEALKPICLVANYSLHASNSFACQIPISGPDPYSPADHWQWAATQWRGVVSPDLTIYVRDGSPGENAIKPAVEFMDEGRVCVLRRTIGMSAGAGAGEMGMGSAGMMVEAASLRRLGFEASEWVRSFGWKGALGS